MPPIPELEEIRKKQILNGAIITISKIGYADVTMADICRESGLSKGGLAHYYKSKYELLKAVFEEFSVLIFEKCRDTMDTFDDPLDKLLSLKLLFNADDQETYCTHPILYDFMSMAVHNTEYRDIYTQWIDSWASLFKEAIELGQDQGRYKKVDSDSAARAISAIYQGLATRWFLAPELHSTEWALDTLKRTVIALLASYE